MLSALIALFLFLPAVDFQFVWDDYTFLVHNESIRSLENVPAFFYDEATVAIREDAPGVYRPLRNTIWSLAYALFKLDSRGYHFLNILLHLANVLALYWLVRGLSVDTWASGLGAALFAAHPLVTEAVAWVKALDDLLVAFFLIVGAGVAARLGRDGVTDPARIPWRRSTILLLLQLGALASKEVGVVFPGICVITYWLGKRFARLRAGEASPPVAGALLERGVLLYCSAALVIDVTYLMLRTRVLGEVAQVVEPLARGAELFWTQLRAIGSGLLLLVWPVPLTADYSSFRISGSADPGSLLSLVTIVALVLLAALGVLQGRLLGGVLAWALSWWALVLLPVSNLVPTMQFMAERFLYPAVVAPAVGFAIVLELSEERWGVRRQLIIAGALLIALLGLRTSQRLPIWSTSISLFSSVVESAPDGWRGLSNLSRAYFTSGRYRDALEQLQRLQEAEPTAPALLDLLGDVEPLAEAEEDLPELLERLDREPGNHELRLRLANLALHARFPQALEGLLQGLPEEYGWQVLAHRAVLAAHLEQPERARDLMARSASQAPEGSEEEMNDWQRWLDRVIAARELKELDPLHTELPEGFEQPLDSGSWSSNP